MTGQDRQPDDLLSPKEIGKLFEVDEQTVRRWRRLGLMPEPSFCVAGLRRWRWDVIQAWIRLGGPAVQKCPEMKKSSEKARPKIKRDQSRSNVNTDPNDA